MATLPQMVSIVALDEYSCSDLPVDADHFQDTGTSAVLHAKGVALPAEDRLVPRSDLIQDRPRARLRDQFKIRMLSHYVWILDDAIYFRPGCLINITERSMVS